MDCRDEIRVKRNKIQDLSSHKQSGITLIALVITVIILLILAGVAMSLITGQNGLFARANQARYDYDRGGQAENQFLVDTNTYLNQYDKSAVKSDLEKLQEYFAKDWDVIYWYDEQTYEDGFNNVEPIMDASISIHTLYYFENFSIMEYHENYYGIYFHTM